MAAPAAVIALLALAAWLVSFGGGARLKAQLKLAADAGGSDGPVTVGPKVAHGIVPEQWAPRIPPGSHLGRHRMYQHPRVCSPNLNAPRQVAYDWLYSPPSEGDL